MKNTAISKSWLRIFKALPETHRRWLAAEKAIELDPDLAEAYVGLGYVFLLTGQPNEAQIRLEQATTLSPEMPEAQFALGITYSEMGQVDKAIAALETFLAIEIPPGCKGDQGLAKEARAQAELILGQLSSQ